MSASERIDPPAANVERVAGQEEHALTAGWEVLRIAPNAAPTPVELAAAPREWRAARVPGTAAMVDAAWGADADAFDHWFRTRFPAPAAQGARALLCCDGLATLAEVWLNGERIGSSDSMWQAHAFDVGARLQPQNELLIRFRALGPVLRERKPRGRWPTRLVNQRHLRFVRTTLIGYMPGFCPEVKPVGPFRPVRLVVQRTIGVERARLDARLEGERGVLEAAIAGVSVSGAAVEKAELVVGDAARAPLSVERDGERFVLRGHAVLDRVEPWWPYTHGAQPLYPARVELRSGGETLVIDLGNVGFRKLEVLRDGGAFTVALNGEKLFCRGACWCPLDLAALHVDEARYREALLRVREGGMNMVRLSGVYIYEADAFYRLCDELGVLIWQDFMFANMDYPVDDPAFMASCEREARQLLERTNGRCSLAVTCGGNEVAQQAAMMGMPKELWSNALFDRLLPELCRELRPDVGYATSSPSGGELPFHTGRGPSHYYGVGAYLRPIDDARLRKVRFASECLAFANVPEEASLRAWFGDETPVAHHPLYKQHVPRDHGVGWDFADVTDHYVELLFGEAARAVRYADSERYFALCRAATGEVMARVQGLWRREESTCKGALIWWLQDLWEGQGLGVVDSAGVPKSPYYFLKRAWSQVALWFVDEGTDGLALHAANDGPDPLSAQIELALYRTDGGVIERASTALELPARSQRTLNADALIGRFVDTSYAYRFGPPYHALCAAKLSVPGTGPEPRLLGRAFHLPLGLAQLGSEELGLTATARELRNGDYEVTALATRFAYAVAVDAPGYAPSDSYFHLAPGEPHRLTLVRGHGAGALRAKLRPLNAGKPTPVRIEPAAGGAAP